MAILITNDDGIESPGIHALYNAIKEIDKTYIIAPMSEKSACSHSIFLFKGIKLEERDENIFALDSTPADCVRTGVLGLIKDNIDLVISGINRGANLGYDVHYSGTVAGAREGAIQGKRSIAFSLYNYDATEEEFVTAAKYAKRIVKSLLESKYTAHEKGIYLNVNFPKNKGTDSPFLELTKIGKRRYRDYIEIEKGEGKTHKITLTGDLPSIVADEGTDGHALDKGFISVTPLSLTYETPSVDLSFLKGTV